jgi:tRNA A37 methylthiotransferase MiaB
MSVEVVTFGCRLNAYESGVISREAENAGLSDTIVFNSCAVTNEAVAQARQSIRKLKRERPEARIVVTGCAAQTQSQMFAGMSEVDRVVGNADKMRADSWRAARAVVKQILRQVNELKRLRISSIDSIEADSDLLDAIASDVRLMPHLHLSLQSGDDLILKRMKRRHLRADAIAFCAQVKKLRPDIAFGADIIAGFPTETEEMFARSLDLVEECDLTFLHVFPYSPRPATPAARMPQVASGAIRERAARLRAAGEAALQKRLATEVGATREVLIESTTNGRTEHFLPVAIAGETAGSTKRLVITGHDGARLIPHSSRTV